MKFSFSLLVISSVLALTNAQAGSFGGPAPFKNGSPLDSGIDGNYQGVARGNSVSGVFRFRIADGMQTVANDDDDNAISIDPNNSWAFFVSGEVYRGITQVGISGSSINGVLDGQSNVNADGQITLPIIISNISANGEFSGKMDLNSPTGSFEGDGTIASAGQNTTTISYTDLFDVQTIVVIDPGPPPVYEILDSSELQTQQIDVPGQPGFGTKSFTIRGTRNSSGNSQASASATP